MIKDGNIFITAVVGNGFNISVFQKYENDNLPTYSNFFDYLGFKKCSSNNMIYNRMRFDKFSN